MRIIMNPYGSNNDANIQNNDYEFANNSFYRDEKKIAKVLNKNISYDNIR